jgi:ribosomal protein L29
MDISTLRSASPAERERLLAEARAKLRDLRFKAATRQLAKVRQIRVLKRDIAQILTVLAN